MNEFQNRRLDSLITDGSVLLGRGDIISKEDIEAHPGPYPIYSSSAQGNGKFGEYGKFMFDEELITWSVDGGGYFFYRDKHRYSVTNVCGYMRVKSSKLQPKFVFYSLANQHRYQTFDYTTKAHPSVIQKLYWLPTIDYEQQEKIATILSGIDTAIEKTEALIAKYQQIKAGLMHDLFTRGVLPNGQLRPIESSSSTKFGKIPFGWKLGSILELTDPQRQPILTGPFGADLGNADFVAEGIPVLRIGNVQQGELDLSDLLYVTPRKAALLSRYRIKSGDLLFARQGATTGRNALATKLVDGFLINYHIIRVALDHERCAPLFVEAAFANEVVKRQIERDKGRGTREGINTAQITSLAFPIAPLNEQRQIAQILKQINLQIEATQVELNSYRMRKCGLMHDLLTGEVPVKVEEPEVVDG